MKPAFRAGAVPAAALALALMSAPALAAEIAPEPALVELFTSQGCASCPRANAVLGAMARQPNTVALTYPVTYWDYLGWRDTFAKPEFNARQKWYAARFHKGVYTPQIVVNGVAHGSGQRQAHLKQLVADVHMAGGARVTARARNGRAAIAVSGAAPSGKAAIWLAQYRPGPEYVSVQRGENAGARIAHYNVVTRLTQLGEWRGGSKRFDAACAPRCAVIVQAESGQVLAAAYAH